MNNHKKTQEENKRHKRFCASWSFLVPVVYPRSGAKETFVGKADLDWPIRASQAKAFWERLPMTVQFVAGDLSVQSIAVDAQNLCGLGLVSAGLGERALDELFFKFAERFI